MPTMESHSYYSLPLPPLPPSQEEQLAINGDAAAQQESQIQVHESDTSISAGDAALATSGAAEVTKSGDVDTDDDKSVVEDEDADSHYQPSEDEDDADTKNMKLNESGKEEAEHEGLEFNKLTDIVLSLKDKTYGSIVRPHFQQMWEERNGTGEDSTSRATAVFDALRKRLKSAGGSFYRGRNPYLKTTDAFFHRANLYLVEDEDEVMRSES